jgi:hypothetical protein
VFDLFLTVLCGTCAIVCWMELLGVILCYLFVICLLFDICLLPFLWCRMKFQRGSKTGPSFLLSPNRRNFCKLVGYTHDLRGTRLRPARSGMGEHG